MVQQRELETEFLQSRLLQLQKPHALRLTPAMGGGASRSFFALNWEFDETSDDILAFREPTCAVRSLTLRRSFASGVSAAAAPAAADAAIIILQASTL